MSKKMRELAWFKNGAYPLFLAPMAGVTDPIFRTLCKEIGADVMVTEFVSAEGVLQAWERNKRYTEFEDDHRPVGIQIFGANGERMGQAAKIIVDEQCPDFIDINCGCPVPKVVGKNGGSSLLKDLDELRSVVRGVVKSVGEVLPVTVKTRVGWDAGSICIREVCKIVEGEGADMLTIHGRTRAQQYSGLSDWRLIDEGARMCSIPVIGNGDICSAARIKEIKETSAVRGIMIGRAAMENPWIFSEAKYFLKHGEVPPAKTLSEKWEFVMRHVKLALESGRYGDELHTMKFMRTRLLAYAKSMPHAKALRKELSQISSVVQLQEIADGSII